jgi:aminoglycoside phosphotransferase (APT) family kinase protein
MVEHPLENRAPEILTREEIMSVLPPLPPYRSAKVVRVSTDLAVKYGTGVQMGEAENMRLAAGVPSLLVPCVHDAWVVEQDVEYIPTHDMTKCTYILMDWIHGDCLAHIWPSLDQTGRGVMVRRIYDMITALHNTILGKPGPVGGGRSGGFWFTDEGAGPFNSCRDMETWFDSRLTVCREYRNAPRDGFSFVDKLRPLVLCHLDIHTHNVIVDKQGSPWLLDWEFAGGYPPYFEGLFMINDHDNPEFTACLRALLENPEHKDQIARIESIGFAVTTGVNIQPS